MKAKLNELRLEAGISRLHDEPKFMVAVSKEGNVIEPLDGLEKFADLIIQECIDCVRGAVLANDVALRNNLGFNDGIAEGVVHIQKHFE
jgi:hypothetical protein